MLNRRRFVGLAAAAVAAPSVVSRASAADWPAKDAVRGARRQSERLTPAELAAFLKSEIEKWGPVIRDAKIRIDN
jgi:tripartite-type tricarboxylate transporter receptor subunit TctC